MIYDVIPRKTMSELCLFLNLTYHILKVVHRSACHLSWFVCHVQLSAYHVQRVCLSHAMTAFMIYICCSDIMMQM